MASTVVEKICGKLAEEILAGRLRPGEKLEEKTLAARFKVSRTPVREALRELSARGLIELVPRKGGTVISFGLAQLADMLEAECEVEALCAMLCAHRMSVVQKKQLEALHLRSHELADRGDERTYLRLNEEFHDLILQGTQNDSLAATARGFRSRLAPFRSAQSGIEKRFELSFEEHGAIVTAILDANPERAYRAMREHDARLSTRVLERLHATQPKQAVAAR